MPRLSSCIAAAGVAAAALAVGVPAVAGARPDGTAVKAMPSKSYGTILETSTGRALYLLTADSTKKLACQHSCISVWHPLLTRGKPVGRKGLDSKLLGTVKRGGARQVTYHGHPLYTYVGDTAAGQANGEGIASFGGTWYVVGTKGAAVTAALKSSTAGSTSGSTSGGGW